jgi:hypothetical protein
MNGKVLLGLLTGSGFFSKDKRHKFFLYFRCQLLLYFKMNEVEVLHLKAKSQKA